MCFFLTSRSWHATESSFASDLAPLETLIPSGVSQPKSPDFVGQTVGKLVRFHAADIAPQPSPTADGGTAGAGTGG